MTESQRSRPAMLRTLLPGARRCLGLAMLSALVLIVAPVVTAAASAAPSVPRSGDTLALLAVQQAELTAADGAANDSFGSSVAVAGDTALVGAGGKTVGGQNGAGAAYIYTRTGTTWSKQVELSDPDPAAGDYFGWSVALSGDTALVAAHGKTVGGQSGAGAVYVFTRTGTTWSEQAELSDPDPAVDDYFGWSVALSGNTALVSAVNRTVTGQDYAGVAYVFVRTGTTWSQQAELSDPDAATNDFFGYRVALSGGTALVDVANRSASAGVAYVFVRSSATWSQQAELAATDAAAGDGFGVWLALSGDTALMGAPYKTVAGHNEVGAAYVFTRSGTAWSQQAELGDPGARGGDRFGSAVALSGSTALVDSPGKTVGGRDGAGAAYVFKRTGTSWSEQAKLSATDAAAGGSFGLSVAVSGDTVLAGACNKTVNGLSAAGVTYVDVLKPAPSLSLKAAPRSPAVHKQLTLSGKVKHFLATGKKVQIYRQAGKHLTALKTLALTKSGGFKWTMKPKTAGTWVFVAAYKVGELTFWSKPVSVKVHR